MHNRSCIKDKEVKGQAVLVDGFLKRYIFALESIGNTLEQEKPDFILALSRKGPRLLELLHIWGIWESEVPVITEKSLDFVPPKEFEGKKVVIFDDIVISGTTLKELVQNLIEKYEAEFKVVCLAIDKDTIAFEKDDEGGYWIELDNGKKFLLDHKLTLKKDERFIFCNEIVRSFIFLNKPYDIDYPVFYIDMNPDNLLSLVKCSGSDTSYNLTTIYQDKNGFSRYSFIPCFNYNMTCFINKKFQSDAQIAKLRLYYDATHESAAFVPIVTFGIDSKVFERENIFVENFQFFNRLIDDISGFIEPANRKQALYRLVWYLLNYLYCISFIIRNYSDSHEQLVVAPSKILNHQDLNLIFGLSASKLILDFLDHYHHEVLKKFKEGEVTVSVPIREIDKPSSSRKERESTFDKKRKLIYDEIRPYIETHLNKDDTLTNQMATIFEGLYYIKEIPTQNRIREMGISGVEHERLRTGFSYEQVKEIMCDQEIIQRESQDVDIKLSLATDFLVDAGIEIPLFYYERDDSFFERAYRYGEDALSSRKYGYLISVTLQNLFEYIYELDGASTLPKIALEKKGVFIQEELVRTGIIDMLKEMIDAGDRKLKIATSFGRHGKILHISDEAYERSKRFIFTEWCSREGIVTDVREGVKFSNEYFEKLRFPDKYLPVLVSEDQVAIFISLSILLYHVDRILDESGQSDFLIALTACGDHESYLCALHEELRLFFKSSDYSFSFPLYRSRKYLSNGKDKRILNDALNHLKTRSFSAVHAIRHKKKLWGEMNDILGSIDKYFSNSDLQLELLYKQNLKFHINRIKSSHNLPVAQVVRKYRENIESFGELCISLATMLRNLLEFSIKVHERRITKSKEIHKTDLAVLDYRLTELRKSMESWNEFIRSNGNIKLGRTLSKLREFTADLVVAPFKYDLNECNKLIQELLPIIRYNYSSLEEFYNGEFSFSEWENKRRRFFPKNKEDLEIKGIEKAIEISKKCIPEDNRVHPKVGAVIIKNNKIVCEAYRGGKDPGDHAEFTALIKKGDGLDLSGATLITTLEPCTSRKHGKYPCALHIIKKGIKRVIVGMIDPNPEIRGKGILFLQQSGVKIDFFPSEYQEVVLKLNREFWKQEWKKYKHALMQEMGPDYEPHEKDIRADFFSQNIPDRTIKTFQVIKDRMSRKEFRTFCDIYLDIDYEELEGETKSGKITSLINNFIRKKSISKLLEALKKYKPEIWREIKSGSKD